MTMQRTGDQAAPAGRVARAWSALWRPSVGFSLGTLLFVGFFAGILFWGGFNWAMEITNTETFCISCHEMRNNAYAELKETVHFTNRTGVRATCPDCHVPRPWHYKVVRKIQATNELYHKVIGTIDAPEKYESQRLALARSVWASMKATDSRECRNCHTMESMDRDKQVRPAKRMHQTALEKGKTCIECHQGVAHKLPKGWDEPAGK